MRRVANRANRRIELNDPSAHGQGNRAGSGRPIRRPSLAPVRRALPVHGISPDPSLTRARAVPATGSDHRQRVDRDTAVAGGADQHRVEVQLLQLGQLDQQLRDARDHSGHRGDIDRRSTPECTQQRCTAQLPEHQPCFVGVDRSQAVGDVLERLGQHAAEPGDDDRAEERVVAPADDQLDQAGRHPLDADTAYARARRASGNPLQQRGVFRAELFVRFNPQRDAASLGLMVDVVGLDLQRDRIAGLAGQLQRLIDAPGQSAGRDRDAVTPE